VYKLTLQITLLIKTVASITKYITYLSSAYVHILSAGAWHDVAIELPQDGGTRVTIITEYTRRNNIIVPMDDHSSSKMERWNEVSFENVMVMMMVMTMMIK